jgi:hypothetical protein
MTVRITTFQTMHKDLICPSAKYSITTSHNLILYLVYNCFIASHMATTFINDIIQTFRVPR